jgi:hypothetical protein
VAADGRVSEAEAEAYARAVGRLVRRNGRPVDAVTARTTDQVLRRRGWAAKPSELFTLLVDADARSGTLSSHRYYQHAMECAQAAADVDAVFTRAELDAVDQLRATLLAAIDGAGLARPPTGDLAPTGPSPTAEGDRGSCPVARGTGGLVSLGSVKASDRHLNLRDRQRASWSPPGSRHQPHVVFMAAGTRRRP